MYFKKITIKIQTFMEAIGNLKIIKSKKERKKKNKFGLHIDEMLKNLKSIRNETKD
jgi:hypothetical protein